MVDYITKYYTKAKKKSILYNELVREILPRINNRAPLLSLTSKLINKLLIERDWSAQKIYHILLNKILKNGLRIVLSVDYRPKKQYKITINIDSKESVTNKSTFDKYKSRPEQYKKISYYNFLRLYGYSIKNLYKLRPRAEARVLGYFPIYNNAPENDQYNDFCRVKLILHHP